MRLLAKRDITRQKGSVHKTVRKFNVGKKLKQSITKEKVILFAKATAVICAFLAFALSMRQKEFDRFNRIKPLFEIVQSLNAREFGLVNHGGIVYFAGCEKNGAGQYINKTPRQYSTLSEKIAKFNFSQPIKEQDHLFIYFRDIDLNSYKVNIIYKADGFYIYGVPKSYRSEDGYCSMSRKLLEYIVTKIFPKDWYEEEVAPKDNILIVKSG